MEKGRRSGGDSSEYVVKNRSSSGCLIVRKKGGGDGVGPSGFDSREKNKKRHRVEFGESGSSDEILMPSRRRLGSETIRVCNGLSGLGKGSDGSGDFGREGGEDFGERKQNRLDIFEFDEYDGNDLGVVRRKGMGDGGVDGRKFHGSVTVGRRGYESGSGVEDRRKSFERTGGMSRGDGSRHPIALLRDKRDSDEPIRVQGKNGVLKVMVNKKKKSGSGESLNMFGLSEATEDRRGARTECFTKRNDLIRPPPYSESKHVEKVSSFSGTLRSPSNVSKSSSGKNGKISSRDSERKNVQVKLSDVEARKSLMKPELNKSAKVCDMDSEDSETSLKRGKKKVDSRSIVKGISEGGEKLPSNQPLPIKAKEGKVKRGSGTEKQKLRERIRQMLLDSGWTIDYRPRKNRDYLDAVYINPSGTAYWSIIKAYEALLKQINVEEDEVKSGDDGSSFAPLPDELLSQLTRKTKKKIENEMKRKKRNDGNDGHVRANPLRRSASSRHDEESMDSDSSHEEKLSSFIKLGGKSLKSKMNSNGSAIVNSKGQSSTHHLPDSSEKASNISHSHPGRKSRKLGRCTLLVRNSTDGLDSETDGFIPYSGKRTLLSWLIDRGFVQLSQKVLYMNRRRTKVMLEGWVTRDGIHCGCCSKILTVSKFEIHAGSKLRQPFQNICLESGVSLLECQVDAWSQQESIEHIGFHTVDTDGDDPNDDTCGICGDGGDLICCDGCPSTFHQSCLDIEMLPPGDWHCPNCTCKFCGVAGEKVLQGGAISISSLLTCSLCSKKYHASCIIENDDSPVDCDAADPCFCRRKCRELFDQLQKHLGVKHELEAGFSWSLIHRTDANLETTPVGLPQKVECNAKLAIALSVMDECFLPIIDRRSGINLVHNVIYNCGSNFNRLNYGGFYAAILERGDELIAAASLRFHGTRLAEMPFIGTRHIYRRQGMCRRLFSAIESALCSFKVEKLIIPAVSELMHTWTEVFGFTTIDKSLKQELKCLNMLVFPGVDMLQKQLFVLERTEGNRNFSTDGAEVVELQKRLSMTSKAATKPDIESLARPDTGGDNHTEVVTLRPDAECSHVPANDASLISGPVDATHEEKGARFLKDAKGTHTESDDKLIESVEDIGHCLSDSSQDVKRLDGETKLPSLVMGNDQSQVVAEEPVTGDSLDASRKHSNPVSLKQHVSVDPQPGGEIGKSEYGQTCTFEIMRGLGQNEIKQELVRPIIEHCQSSKLDIDVIDASNMGNSISDGTDSSVTIREVKPTDPRVVHRSAEVVLQEEFLFNYNTGLSAAEKKPDLMLVSGDKGCTQPDGECDIGDAEPVNAGLCPKGPYLPEQVLAESSPKNVDETDGVAVSRFRDAGDATVEVASEPDNKCV